VKYGLKPMPVATVSLVGGGEEDVNNDDCCKAIEPALTVAASQEDDDDEDYCEILEVWPYLPKAKNRR
jgi:hypothetical protein